MKWRGVMVHHSSTTDTESAETHRFRREHRAKGWSDIGYHFVVEHLGHEYAALVGRPLNRVGSHCPGVNKTHIGVCFVGNFDMGPPSSEQLEVGAAVIAGLLDAFDLETGSVIAHRDRRATACPGSEFPMAHLLDIIAKKRNL